MNQRFSKILFFFIFFSATSLRLLAQPEIVFDSPKHDFGEVTEGDIVTHEFKFQNTGNEPLILSKVKASCGCTTPNWPKEPIAPGKSSIITAAFNSKNRPGSFNKGISITSNAKSPQMMVTIHGKVVEKPRYTSEEIAKSPKIVLFNEKVKLKKVERMRPTSVIITIQNVGPTILQLKNLNSTCDCVGFGKGSDFKVEPGHSKNFRFVYRPRNNGEVREKVTIITNDITRPEISFEIYATVVETL